MSQNAYIALMLATKSRDILGTRKVGAHFEATRDCSGFDGHNIFSYKLLATPRHIKEHVKPVQTKYCASLIGQVFSYMESQARPQYIPL
jgi:hypothetical protein